MLFQLQHLKQRQRGFFAFVAMRPAGPFQRLFFVVDREYTKSNRPGKTQACIQNAAGSGIAHVFEMRRTTAYNTSQANHAVVTGFQTPLSGKGQFKSPGDTVQIELAIVETETQQGCFCTCCERIYDVAVPAGIQNSNAQKLRTQPMQIGCTIRAWTCHFAAGIRD